MLATVKSYVIFRKSKGREENDEPRVAYDVSSLLNEFAEGSEEKAKTMAGRLLE